MLLELAYQEGSFVAALLTGKERRKKEEAGPSPIPASRVWVQDDSEKLLRKAEAEAEEKEKERPFKPKGRAAAKDRARSTFAKSAG
jgi:hypothetical protein